MSKKAIAMIQSLNDMDEVEIISENDCNHVIAEYQGQRCTAVFNEFSGLYYVDDVYGLIEEKENEI